MIYGVDRRASFLSALTQEHRALLGECVAQAAFLEGLLASLLDRLPEGDGKNLRRPGDSPAKCIKRARARIRLLPESEHELWREWLTYAKAALDARNEIVHTLWLTGRGEVSHGLNRSERANVAMFQELTRERLMVARTRLIQARMDGRKLMKRLPTPDDPST